MTEEPARATYGDVFGIAEFRALFVAYVASILGDVVAAVALTVLVFERTHSPLLAALTFSLAFLPFLFVGTLLTSLVDRLPARRVLVACDLASAALVAAMATPGLPLAAVFVLLVLLSLIGPLFSIVRAGTLPDVLGAGPEFVLGRSLLRLVAQLAQVLGNAVGGLLLIAFAPRGVLLVDAGSFLVSAALLRFGTPDRPRRAEYSETSVVRDSLGGLRRVLSRRTLRRLLLFSWLVPACTAAPEALAAPYTHAIGRSASAVGFFLIGLPAGVALGNLVVARFLPASRQRRIVTPAAFLACAPLALFLFSPGLVPAIALLVVAGAGFGFSPGLDQLLLRAAGDLQARALATSQAGLMFAQGVGFILWGAAAELVSVRLVLAAAAVCGVGVVLLLRPAAE